MTLATNVALLRARGIQHANVSGNAEVPSVVGKTAMEARQELEERELVAEFSPQTPSNEDRCQVTEQDQPPGKEVEQAHRSG
jgi:beta-lactam-binding protein with PASTA domain